jgi:hypothetical protein
MLVLPEDVASTRLISDEYRRQQEVLHRDPEYGRTGEMMAPLVAKVLNDYGIEELLDYGAGKGRLAQTIVQHNLVDHRMRIQQYEPAIPKWSGLPEPCDMVACIDVLEHIEPDKLDVVLDDLQRVTRFIGLFTVSTMAAMKVLADGRNAHLIVEPVEWWLPKIMGRWELHTFQRQPDGFLVLVKAREIT